MCVIVRRFKAEYNKKKNFISLFLSNVFMIFITPRIGIFCCCGRNFILEKCVLRRVIINNVLAILYGIFKIPFYAMWKIPVVYAVVM